MTVNPRLILALLLTLVLAACNASGSSTDDGTDDPSDQDDNTLPEPDPDPDPDPDPTPDPDPIPDPTPEPEPDPLPNVIMSLTEGNSTIIVDWNEASFENVTFNLCLAEAPLTGGIENCGIHNGAQYSSDITSPYTISGLTNNQAYWLQLEADAGEGLTSVSSIQVARPEDPDAAPGTEVERVLGRADLGNQNANRIFSAGPYAIIKLFYGVDIWSSLGTEETTTKISLDEDTYTTIRRGATQVFENNNELYFVVDREIEAGRGADIWKTDGTAEGTRLVVSGNVLGLGNNAQVRQFAAVGDRVAFVAYYPEVVQDRIFIIDSESEGGAFVLPNFQPYNAGVGNKLIGHQGSFYASSSQAGNRSLHRINPETGATTEVWSMGGSSSNRRAPSEMISVDNRIYFSAIDDDGPALWKFQSGAATRLFNPNPDEPSNGDLRNSYNVTVADGRLYFFSNHYDEDITTNNGWRFDARLAYSDGTIGGTGSTWKSELGSGWTVQDILNRNTLPVGDRFIFESPSNAPDGLERRWWISNGTASGTLPVFVDSETVIAESSRERSVSTGDVAWVTNSARQNIFAISNQSTGNARIDQNFRTIDNLTLVGNALWFTACPEDGFSNCTAVWRIVPDTDEQDDD